MALPQNYLTQSMSTSPRTWWWLEIAGLPRAYGNFSGSYTLFQERQYNPWRLNGVKPLMLEPPRGFSQQIDPLSGESSLSSIQIKLVDHDAKANQVSQLTTALGLSKNRTILNATSAGRLVEAQYVYHNSSGSLTTGSINVNSDTGTPVIPSYATYVLSMVFSSSYDVSSYYPTASGDIVVNNERFRYADVIWIRRGSGYQNWFRGCQRSYFTDFQSTTGSLNTETYAYQQEALFLNTSASYVSASTQYKDPFNPYSKDIYGGTVGLPDIQTIGSRLCTLYSYLSSSQPSTAAEIMSSSVVRFRGFVSSVQQLEGGTGYELKIDSVDRKIAGFIGKDKTKKLFSNQIKTKLVKGLAYSSTKQMSDGTEDDDFDALTSFAPFYKPPVGTTYNTTVIEVPRSDIDFMLSGSANNPRNNGLARLNKIRFNKAVFFVKIDDEILAIEDNFVPSALERSYTNILTIPSQKTLYIIKRGCFGTKIEGHKAGSEMIEVMPLVGSLTGKFIASPLDERVWLPLMKTDIGSILLNILTSTGVRSSNGAYDTFPDDWSLAIPQAWIDVAEIELIRNRLLPVGCSTIITEPFEVLNFIREQVSKPFRLFPVNKLNGLFTLRAYDPPTPRTTNKFIINHSDLINTPRWDANLGSSIGQVTIESNKNIKGDYGVVTPFLNVDAMTLFDGAYGSIKIESDFLRDGPTFDDQSNYRFQTDTLAAGSQHINDLVSWYEAWWTVPRPVIDIKLKYKQHIVEPGDYLILSSSIIPNEDGTLGVTSASLFVTSKKFDDTKGYVNLSCIDMQNAGQVRNIAPSIIISSASNQGSNTYRVYAQVGQLGCAPLSGENDCSFFYVGDKVKVWRANLDLSSSLATVTAVNSTSIDINATSYGSLIPSIGCVIMYAPYEQSVSSQQSMYAYMANEAYQLVTGSAGVYTTGSAHIHIP